MKKISLLGLLLFTLTGCNVSIVDTNYSYDEALISLPDGTMQHVYVKSWKDYSNSDSISINTKDGKKIYTHMSNVVLYTDK